MTIFYGARDELEISSEPRPWLAAKRAAAIVLGMIVGAEFVIGLWLLIGE